MATLQERATRIAELERKAASGRTTPGPILLSDGDAKRTADARERLNTDIRRAQQAQQQRIDQAVRDARSEPRTRTEAVGGGTTRGIARFLGAPVDLTAGALNLLLPGDPFQKPIGGSESLVGGLQAAAPLAPGVLPVGESTEFPRAQRIGEEVGEGSAALLTLGVGGASSAARGAQGGTAVRQTGRQLARQAATDLAEKPLRTLGREAVESTSAVLGAEALAEANPALAGTGAFLAPIATGSVITGAGAGARQARKTVKAKKKATKIVANIGRAIGEENVEKAIAAEAAVKLEVPGAELTLNQLTDGNKDAEALVALVSRMAAEGDKPSGAEALRQRGERTEAAIGRREAELFPDSKAGQEAATVLSARISKLSQDARGVTERFAAGFEADAAAARQQAETGVAQVVGEAPDSAGRVAEGARLRDRSDALEAVVDQVSDKLYNDLNTLSPRGTLDEITTPFDSVGQTILKMEESARKELPNGVQDLPLVIRRLSSDPRIRGGANNEELDQLIRNGRGPGQQNAPISEQERQAFREVLGTEAPPTDVSINQLRNLRSNILEEQRILAGATVPDRRQQALLRKLMESVDDAMVNADPTIAAGMKRANGFYKKYKVPFFEGNLAAISRLAPSRPGGEAVPDTGVLPRFVRAATREGGDVEAIEELKGAFTRIMGENDGQRAFDSHIAPQLALDFRNRMAESSDPAKTLRTFQNDFAATLDASASQKKRYATLESAKSAADTAQGLADTARDAATNINKTASIGALAEKLEGENPVLVVHRAMQSDAPARELNKIARFARGDAQAMEGLRVLVLGSMDKKFVARTGGGQLFEQTPAMFQGKEFLDWLGPASAPTEQRRLLVAASSPEHVKNLERFAEISQRASQQVDTPGQLPDVRPGPAAWVARKIIQHAFFVGFSKFGAARITSTVAAAGALDSLDRATQQQLRIVAEEAATNAVFLKEIMATLPSNLSQRAAFKRRMNGIIEAVITKGEKALQQPTTAVAAGTGLVSQAQEAVNQ